MRGLDGLETNAINNLMANQERPLCARAKHDDCAAVFRSRSNADADDADAAEIYLEICRARVREVHRRKWRTKARRSDLGHGLRRNIAYGQVGQFRRYDAPAYLGASNSDPSKKGHFGAWADQRKGAAAPASGKRATDWV